MKHSYILILLLIAFILTGCPDNTVSPDPCAGKKPFKADFNIYEVPYTEYNGWKYYDTDTSLTSSLIFTALQSNVEYEWHIGSEIIKDKTFQRNNFPTGASIPIQLIIRYKPDSLCFPNDDGIDTVKRNIYIMGFKKDTTFAKELFSGSYKGFNVDAPNDIFIITFDWNYPDPDNSPNEGFKTLRLKGLTSECDLFSNWDLLFEGFKKCYFRHVTDYQCLTPEGIATLSGMNNDSITIDYNIQKQKGYQYVKDRINKKFIGVRIK